MTPGRSEAQEAVAEAGRTRSEQRRRTLGYVEQRSDESARRRQAFLRRSRPLGSWDALYPWASPPAFQAASRSLRNAAKRPSAMAVRAWSTRDR